MRKRLLSMITGAALAGMMVTGSVTGVYAAKNDKKEETTTEAETEEESEEETEETDEALEELLERKDELDGKLVYLVSKGFQHQYWQAVYQGAKEMAEELGVKMQMEGPATESDIADQVQMLNNAVNQKPFAIGLAALDTEACLEGITQAMNFNIPIIGFDSGVANAPEGAVYANASTDNYAAGELAAEKSFELIEDKLESGVKIGVLSQDATSESIISRGTGFIDKMRELIEENTDLTVSVEGHEKFADEEKVKDADVIIEVAVPAQVQAELSVVDAQKMLNDDAFICIYGSNQFSGEGLVNANSNLNKLGEDGVIGVAFDSGTVIKGAVADGTLAGAVTQDPLNIGRTTVKLACMAALGMEVEDVDTGCQWYTAENMEDEGIAPNLYD